MVHMRSPVLNPCKLLGVCRIPGHHLLPAVCSPPPASLALSSLPQAVHAKHGEILQLLNTLKKVKREVRPTCFF